MNDLGGDIRRPEQIADATGYTVETIRDLARRGELPGARKLGRRWIIYEPTFRAWLAQGSTPTPTALDSESPFPAPQIEPAPTPARRKASIVALEPGSVASRFAKRLAEGSGRR